MCIIQIYAWDNVEWWNWHTEAHNSTNHKCNTISVRPDSREMSDHVLSAGFREHSVKQRFDYFRGPWPILAEAHAYSVYWVTRNCFALAACPVRMYCNLCAIKNKLYLSQIGELRNFMGQVQFRLSTSLPVWRHHRQLCIFCAGNQQ